VGGAHRRCYPFGECSGLGRNQNGEDEIGLAYQGCIVSYIDHPGLRG
jgi:hypothetical protein